MFYCSYSRRNSARSVLIASLVWSLVASAFGRPVSLKDASLVGQAVKEAKAHDGTLQASTTGAPPAASSDAVIPITDSATQETLAYVMMLKPRGYIILSADTEPASGHCVLYD